MARNMQTEYRKIALGLLAQRDGWKCHYCGTDLQSWMETESHLVVIEHKNAGEALRTDPDNLVIACMACNTRKKDTPYADYRERLSKRIPMEQVIAEFRPLSQFARDIVKWIALRQPIE